MDNDKAPVLQEFDRLELADLGYTSWDGTFYQTWNVGYHLTEIYDRLNDLSEAVNVLIRERADQTKGE